MPGKPVRWVGSSLRDLRAWPESARQQAGRQLRRLQEGLPPNDWRPIPTIGPGVAEIRLHVEGERRLLYMAQFAEAIYVLHVFQKHSSRTPQMHLELARKRLASVVRLRREV